MKTNRTSFILALAAVPIALAAVAMLLSGSFGAANHAKADSSHPGLELHIDVTGGGGGCTTAGDAKGSCTITTGSTFVVNSYLDALGGLTAYDALEVGLSYTGVSAPAAGSGVKDMNVWPSCVAAFEAFSGGGAPPASTLVSCVKGVFAPSSTYTGKIATNTFTCTNDGTITMTHGGSDTAVFDPGGSTSHSEAGPDVLNIDCVTPLNISGNWNATYAGAASGTCVFDIIQTGTALAWSGSCTGLGAISATGFINTSTGVFSVGPGCTIAGTATTGGNVKGGTWTCGALSGPIVATRKTCADYDGDRICDYKDDSDGDGDGCPDGKELGPYATEGGLRDPANQWDYFNPTQDGINRTDDVTRIVQHYGHDAGGMPPDLLYSQDYDRTPLAGGYRWQFDAPNGQIRTFDITAAVLSYGHDCS